MSRDHGEGDGLNLRLAMTAPWSIELDQNVFAVIQHNVFEVLRDNYCHWSFLLLRDRLGLDTGFDAAINIVLHKLAHVLLG